MTATKEALILDNIDRGTILTTLDTNGYYRRRKLLKSSVKNWISICKILEDDLNDSIVVIGKFTEHTLFKMCSPNYEPVVKRLLELLKRKKHILFIYKENLLGNFSYFKTFKINDEVFEMDDREDYLYYSKKDIRSWLQFHGIEKNESEFIDKVRLFIKELNKGDLNILPYEKLIDVEISGQNFIENIADGLLLRIYVPNERIWSNEFDKFITLFRDYASSVSRQELKITQNRTDLGIICSLYSINDTTEQEINDLYKEFTSFMDICASNPDEARRHIDNYKIPELKKQKIFQKFIREAQRLALDLRHDRELKYISIKHRLENELQETQLSNDVLDYVNSALPDFKESRNILGPRPVINAQTVYINPQIINKVEGIVCNELNGNINFTPEEIELTILIERFAGELSEITTLKTALYELKDNATTNEQKRSSWQRLHGFISKVADKIGDVAVALLTKYIEQKMNG